jgi:hypothetical protein
VIPTRIIALLAGVALRALPELKFDFVEIETLERLSFGHGHDPIPKSELKV